MEELREELARILNQRCPIKQVNRLIDVVEITGDNIAEINEAIKALELHEAEIRNVRQLLAQKCMKFWVTDWISKNRLGR